MTDLPVDQPAAAAGTAPNSVESRLDSLAAEVAGLRDLFTRRLLDDKARNALYQASQDQSKAITDILTQRAFADLFKEMLLALDALQRDDLTLEVAHGVAEEILESFRRRGVVEIVASGAIDLATQELVGTCAADLNHPVGNVAAVVRRGYILADRVLRPAQVIVAVELAPAVQSPSAEATGTYAQ